ncbi:hypothetical protein Tco_1055427 [Tanacetum coccineum]|uniref:Uncharacterized protein n=1 Tax=Tanacetum coccineum TaxID=301880 RepID=A0ABQ5H0B1_9ASTR
MSCHVSDDVYATWSATSWQLANASLPRGRSNASKIADTRLRVREDASRSTRGTHRLAQNGINSLAATAILGTDLGAIMANLRQLLRRLRREIPKIPFTWAGLFILPAYAEKRVLDF